MCVCVYVCVCVCVKSDILRKKVCISFRVKLAKELRGRASEGILQKTSEVSVPDLVKTFKPSAVKITLIFPTVWHKIDCPEDP